ncbi:MAG: 1-(5-phosphoribosyl)-5-[(5-phosphoribosylamino)methylideneamino]imidazole-4-carboxamide isomerase, partial [Chloroflexi bacterium]|nr:1-(5-phosphoribosyl)-5-[(5-phosphoribosylamino)methylideneamino]imidazole-4-carboxamide isomerase [Chloroflexota bacterium]
MEVIPAIDLLGGKCVRLYQGDYARETVYSEAPESVAVQWVKQGATRLHVVDLDGAKAGKPTNLAAIRAIVKAVEVPVQLGGGIRTLDTAKSAIDMGIERVILGTIAIEQPALVEELCRILGTEHIIVGVDAKDGYVAVRGWTEGSETTALDLARNMATAGVTRIMYTDVSRDGTLTEPNFEGVEELVQKSRLKVLAAGGIAASHHLVKLAQIGADAAIVGKALYTGNIDLKTALYEVGAIS